MNLGGPQLLSMEKVYAKANDNAARFYVAR